MIYCGATHKDEMTNKVVVGIVIVCTVAIISAMALLQVGPWDRAHTLSVGVDPPQAGLVFPAGGEYESGVQVTLTANPASGYTFDYWAGGASGTSSTTTIVMDSDKGVTAHFKEIPTVTFTLADAPTILDLSAELPRDFTSRYSSEPSESDLLGVGSGSQFHTRGTILITRPWCQVQLILWVVDPEVAQNTSVEKALAEYHLTGNRIDVGNEAEAIKDGDYGDGFEFLIIKYRNAYVIMNSWYSHPEDEYVEMIELANVIVERLIGYST